MEPSERNRLWSMVTVPQRSTECMETAQGDYASYSLQKDNTSRLQECYESPLHRQATGCEKSDLHPERDVLKWMKEWQCSYTDKQLNFWTLLCPLMDGGEMASQHLACQLLSMWHWSSVLNPSVYPPVPSRLNIGHWVREDTNVSEHQKWVEAYACILK